MDLELVETNALLDELLKRFDHVVFVGLKGHTVEKQKMAARSYGNPFTCAGLAHLIAKKSIERFISTAVSGDTKDL